MCASCTVKYRYTYSINNYLMCRLYLLFLSLSLAVADNDNYIAAVVELAALQGANPDNIAINVRTIINFIALAKSEKAEIVVFPELGVIGYSDIFEPMTTLVPDPEKRVIPCLSHEYSQILRNISCSSRDNAIYVVINLIEKVYCFHLTNCPANGWKTYNTNVVFDRSGMVINKYSKLHLFDEPEISTSPPLTDSIFETDFGVRFGSFICFDMYYEWPALHLVRDLGVTDIIYPTATYNQLPFRASLSISAGWSYSEDVNLLSAAYNNPSIGCTGSSIYLGRNGLANYTISEKRGNRLITASIPKKTPRVRKKLFVVEETVTASSTGIFRDIKSDAGDLAEEETSQKDEFNVLMEDITYFASAPLKKLTRRLPLCHHNLCCYFNSSMATSDDTFYHAVVYNGVMQYPFNMGTGGFQICGVVACKNDSLTSCGTRLSPATTFNYLSIEGNFQTIRATVMPISITSELTPLPIKSFNLEKHCTIVSCHYNYASIDQLSNILTFALYGRIFSLDGMPFGKPLFSK